MLLTRKRGEADASGMCCIGVHGCVCACVRVSPLRRFYTPCFPTCAEPFSDSSILKLQSPSSPFTPISTHTHTPTHTPPPTRLAAHECARWEGGRGVLHVAIRQMRELDATGRGAREGNCETKRVHLVALSATFSTSKGSMHGK